jgi:uncharacterized membrane protein
MREPAENKKGFPVAAGVFLGIGLGGFFDGIVLHQLLQWHHMFTSAGYPADSVANLQVNTFWDGMFHALTYVCVAVGLAILWRAAHREHAWWSGKMLLGAMLLGFGWFNVVEGTIDHHLLKIHHVNETAPADQWLYWDLAFLAWGAAMVVAGWLLLRAGKQRTNTLAVAAAPVAKDRQAPESGNSDQDVHHA